MGGGDKCLSPLAGKPLIGHIIEAIAPQALGILINTNSDPALFARYDLPVLPDAFPGFEGPLAGVLTGMKWSRRHYPRAPYILTVPGDVPFLPGDLMVRLTQSLKEQNGDIAIARCALRSHPIVGLWPVDLAERLERDLQETNIRSLRYWLNGFRVAQAEFPQVALFNVNTPADLDLCHAALQSARQIAV
jgi:molybdopterin-guanine dinucleotide biosynthesis protein A